jgi:trehalose 6-phosphate phosphatase
MSLERLRAALGDAVVALDYDGTLAPIVDRPSDAVPAAGALDVLRALAPRARTLALVTGRPADVVVELGGLADVPGLVVLGQYGAQRWEYGRLRTEPPLPGVEQVRAALPDLLAVEGAELEDKGIALVVHTRRAPDPSGALVRLAGKLGALAAAAGLEVHPGRLVLELRPPGHDKRTALLSLCGRRGSWACSCAARATRARPSCASGRTSWWTARRGSWSCCAGCSDEPAQMSPQGPSTSTSQRVRAGLL